MGVCTYARVCVHMSTTFWMPGLVTTPLSWGVPFLPGEVLGKDSPMAPSDFLLLFTLLCNPFPLCAGEPVTSFKKYILFYLFIHFDCVGS